eukprot:TRINITY_DN4966_c0_g1_i2.p1 TRINITY_DN4966_c0_g1~~TRINITY_DN4966_c0_g1_i2.p1  ORF type:complete len:155 (+),score=13.28 TRINITY_DN4966_c0_g1_i2:242-706(+)
MSRVNGQPEDSYCARCRKVSQIFCHECGMNLCRDCSREQHKGKNQEHRITDKADLKSSGERGASLPSPLVGSPVRPTLTYSNPVQRQGPGSGIGPGPRPNMNRPVSPGPVKPEAPLRPLSPGRSAGPLIGDRSAGATNPATRGLSPPNSRPYPR